MTHYTLPDTAVTPDVSHLLPILHRGDWGDGVEAVCAMSALVAGADDVSDCITAGWSDDVGADWLPGVIVRLFDEDVGADDEEVAAREWFVALHGAVQGQAIDYRAARHRFLIGVLADGQHSALATLHSLDGDGAQQIAAIEAAVARHRRALASDAPTDEEWDAAWVGARAAAWGAEAAARAEHRSLLLTALHQSTKQGDARDV